MKKLAFTTVSALALVAASPAFSTDAETSTVAPAAEQTTGSVTKDVENAWEDIKDDTSEAYEKIKATFVGETGDEEFSSVIIDSRMTASGMIGKPVYNDSGESVAKVEDIIVDDNGKAVMIVVSDGEFIGLGKKAAFDYNAVARVGANGDVIMPITEETIDRAAEFSYDREDNNGGKNVRLIPKHGFSAAELLKGQLVNSKNDTVAEIDNIYFENGRASQLIVGFDKILGLGGKKVALNYNKANLISDGDGFDYQLSSDQAAQFDIYKKTTTN